MDPVWTSLLSGATGAVVVGYIARLLLERTLRTIDELRAEVRALLSTDATIDKRLELGNQKFDYQKGWNEDIARRVRELEIETRSHVPTVITRAGPK